MLLLAADTSGRNGSIALAQCGPGNECAVLEVVPLAGGTFSAQFVPQIAALLEKHGFTKNDIGGFAVASGPGSFTGLRVGLAAIKALAEALEKPIAAVSLLEAVAAAANSSEKTLAALDGGRGEIYAGEYQANRLTGFGECLLTSEEFFSAALNRTVVTPDISIAEKMRTANLRVQVVCAPQSDSIAVLGWKKIQSRAIVSPEDLDANYIRRSDAELFAKVPPGR